MRPIPASLVPLALVLSTPSALAQGTIGLVLPDADDIDGSCAVVGDVDGDGAADYAFGASGEVVVVSGKTREQLYSIATSTAPWAWGRVAGVGDLDGDGKDDLLVGDVAGARALAVSGATGALLYEVQAGASPSGSFGVAVGGPGDLSGDGVPDLLVGAHTADAGAISRAGTVRVCSGVDGSTLYEVSGEEPQTFLGAAIAALGDLDGDGMGDFAAGGHGIAPSGTTGRVRGYSGASGALLFEIVSPDNDRFGAGVARVRDVDGDGLDELLVARPFAATGARSDLYSTGFPTLLRSFEGAGGLADLGDVDLDGSTDVAVGTSAGVRVYSADSGALVYEVLSPLAVDTAGPGDVDGDGQADLLWGTRLVRFGDCSLDVGSFCATPAPNSVGPGAFLELTGSLTASANNAGLAIEGGPPGATGLVIYSNHRPLPTGAVPFGDGWLCFGGQTGLMQYPTYRELVPLRFGPHGGARVALDLDAPPLDSGPGAIAPFRGASFQVLYRDPLGPGGTGFNASSAFSATFCP